MSNLSISSSNRKACVAIAAAAIVLFALDHYLWADRGFLKHYGYGTQEGQIVAKLDRAPRQTADADVIFLGSSTMRSNVSSRPFLDQGILPLNLGISGGGPVYCYYALKRIAPEISHRSAKPILFLEVSPLALFTGWSEYPHLFSTIQSRWDILADLPFLIENFRKTGSSQAFVETAALPSLTYRAYARSIGSASTQDLKNLVSIGHDENTFFYGVDDPWGYAPLYGRVKVAPGTHPSSSPITVCDIKLTYLRRTLRLALQLGMRVVLLESSVSFNGPAVPEATFVQLAREFPAVETIRVRDCGFQFEDFEDAHLNIWGADRYSKRIIDLLHLTGDSASLPERQNRTIRLISIPPVSSWNFKAGAAHAIDGDSYAVETAPVSGRMRPVATSPAIPVSPGDHYILEFEVLNPAGAGVEFGPVDASKRLKYYTSVVIGLPQHFPEGERSPRYYLRLTPRFATAAIVVLPGKAGGAQIRFTRLFHELP